MDAPKLYTITNWVFPDTALCSELHLYFRCDPASYYSFEKRQLHFQENGAVTVDTYFNSFSVGKWKKYTGINNVFFSLTGAGKFLLRFGLRRYCHGLRWLSDYEVTLSGEEQTVELPFWYGIDDGILIIEILSLSAGWLSGARYLTSSEPCTSVTLGIVITTFNRQPYTIGAENRIREQLLSDSEWCEHIQLIIVDNGRNLSPDDVPSACVIPNKNLGGTGGFTRGLLHLLGSGVFTHCLFMDDDASCEVESIKRTYRLLQYSHVSNLAIAGALFREVEPFRQFENGARFDGLCRPIKSGLDMRDYSAVVLNEVEEVVDYGGWWFFAFALKDVKELPFPFFVRGDDVMFALRHKFKILTMNGICSWADDFSLKSGPLPTYLDVRSHLIQGLVENIRITPFQLVLLTWRFFAASALSYNYATAKAVILAVRDVLAGPTFFEQFPDAANTREEIAGFAGVEKVTAIDRASIAFVQPRGLRESKFRFLWRWLSFNGHLIPHCFLKRGIVFQPKSFHGSLRQIFGWKHVLYLYEPLSIGYIIDQNKRVFFRLLWSQVLMSLKLFMRTKSLKRQYAEAHKYLTSAAFWNRVLY
jgi:galactofuranosylgalactofuranosylrhamnosyl-N-acetylglucosaminyl-diphospho-decaprenol beta-1,5/1,6-galactofuranosyltransferase